MKKLLLYLFLLLPLINAAATMPILKDSVVVIHPVIVINHNGIDTIKIGQQTVIIKVEMGGGNSGLIAATEAILLVIILSVLSVWILSKILPRGPNFKK